MNTELTLMSIVALITLAASGGALFVSMKVSNSLNTFRIDFLRELDERYVRQHEYAQVETMRKELDLVYRTVTNGQIAGMVVEVRRDKSDLTIALKGLLTAIGELKEDTLRGRKQ